mmetsp:Transcript_43262/g.122550  ORF Transcript_43262/g.122550 Transcript_43262/m.122550 type:complete len:159 (-) Transcript_43262:159-635(-)
MEPTTKEQHDHMSKVPYREAVGSLLYSAVTLRPDIAYAVKECAMYCNCAGKRHWEAIKHIIRYLENGRSTGGYVIYLCGNPVIWRCKNQPIVAASTTEEAFGTKSERTTILVREKVEAGEVEVGWIPSAENVADVLTKNLPRGTRMDVESDEESDMDT